MESVRIGTPENNNVLDRGGKHQRRRGSELLDSAGSARRLPAGFLGQATHLCHCQRPCWRIWADEVKSSCGSRCDAVIVDLHKWPRNHPTTCRWHRSGWR